MNDAASLMTSNVFDAASLMTSSEKKREKGQAKRRDPNPTQAGYVMTSIASSSFYVLPVGRHPDRSAEAVKQSFRHVARNSAKLDHASERRLRAPNC